MSVKITQWNGTAEIASWTIPAYSDEEIRTILQRLVCTTLSPTEVIDASRRRNDKMRTSLLDPVTTGKELDYGESAHFTARLVD